MFIKVLVLAQQSRELTEGEAAAIITALIVGGLIALAIGLAIAIVICVVLYSAIMRVPAEHRRIEPGQVWLLLIPIFNWFWNFKVFPGISDSFRSYFAAIGRTDVGDCGRSLGMAYCWLTIAATLGSLIPLVNCFAGLAGLAGIVLLIIYLVKVTQLKSMIGAPMAPPPAMAAGSPPGPPSGM